MSERLTQETVIRNIVFLARKKGFKIKELESGIGVSQGYFSRCIKSNCKIHLIHVLDAAHFIGCPIVTLFDEKLSARAEYECVKSQMESLQSRKEELEETLRK